MRAARLSTSYSKRQFPTTAPLEKLVSNRLGVVEKLRTARLPPTKPFDDIATGLLWHSRAIRQ